MPSSNIITGDYSGTGKCYNVTRGRVVLKWEPQIKTWRNVYPTETDNKIGYFIVPSLHTPKYSDPEFSGTSKVEVEEPLDSDGTTLLRVRPEDLLIAGKSLDSVGRLSVYTLTPVEPEKSGRISILLLSVHTYGSTLVVFLMVLTVGCLYTLY